MDTQKANELTLETETESNGKLGNGKLRHVPEYIKPYGWAVKYIGTAQFKEVVEGIMADLNGNKEKPNFTYRGVETALRALKKEQDASAAQLKALEEAEAAKAAKKAEQEKKRARLEEFKAKAIGATA
jgi:hypothetical protein